MPTRGGAVTYSYMNFKVLAVLLGHATRVTFLEMPNDGLLSRWVYYPEPQLTLQLSRSNHIAVLSYGFNTAFSSLLGRLPRPVLLNFRSTLVGDPVFRVHYGHGAMAYYSYGNPISRLSADLALRYHYNPNPSVQRNIVSSNRTLAYVMEGKQSDNIEGIVNCNFFIPTIITNIKFTAQGAQGRFAQYINDAVFDVRSRSAFASLSVHTSVRRIFDVQLGANWSTVSLDNGRSRSLHHDMAQFIEAQLYVKPVRISASADRIEVGLMRSHENAIYFLDASVECEIIKEKLSGYLEGRNLLNNRYYSQRNDGNIETVQMHYEIPALQVFAGIRWRF